MINKLLSKKQRKLSKKARWRYQNLFEEEKEKKRQYARERYRNLSEEEKRKKSVNMVVNAIKAFWRIYIKKVFYNVRNKDYLSVKIFLLHLPKIGS